MMKTPETSAPSTLLLPSSRVALAAFLHDLGKFAERARMDVDEETLSANKQLYCPYHQDGGWFSHVHAAYTAVALDQIEPHLPPLKGKDVAPFASWQADNVDDSLINGAAGHHQPNTFLQWIIATADRVASGFERNEFKQYNQAKEGTTTGKNHYTARQLTLFEQIRLSDGNRKQEYAYRYKLQPLCPDALMPVKADGYESNDKAAAQTEYRRLWDEFIEGLEKIPPAHKRQLPLWLDHFESLWGCYTHAIPSATAFNTRPDVSLYDHSKATASLAVALWRYHHERGDDETQVTGRMRHREDWDEQKLLLIQGDFFGIQNFIFATGGETQKRAAKLLRGRSFYVSLLTECAALKVLDRLGLPATSRITSAAGKFLIVAPNTEAVQKELAQAQQELDQWFLQHTWGVSGIGLATTPAGCNDFLKQGGKDGQPTPFQSLMEKLFTALEKVKLRRFDLCSQASTAAILSGFQEQWDKNKGVCKIDGVSPASQTDKKDDGIHLCDLACDQIAVGNYLTKYGRFLITRSKPDHHTLVLPIFGYHVSFTKPEDVTGRFSDLAVNSDLLRAFDFSLPEPGDKALWNGYARRYINGYVPRFDEDDLCNQDKYKGVDEPVEEGAIKSLEHIAREREDKKEDKGVVALMTLKGDVDNLGMIFQKGLVDQKHGEGMSFAKMAGLSRQMDAFFTIYLPYRCRTEYLDTYTVFAGGDDFFLIGPWYSQIKLARDMHRWFHEYVAHNLEVHFSAGLSMTKPGLPIRHLAEQSEQMLEQAKQHNPGRSRQAPKNAITCYGQPVPWTTFDTLLEKADALDKVDGELGLSTGYLYGLLRFVAMQEGINNKPENTLWRAWFAYRTQRLLERKRDLDDGQRREWHNELATRIAAEGIEKHEGAYRIALFTHLYRHRKEGQR